MIIIKNKLLFCRTYTTFNSTVGHFTSNLFFFYIAIYFVSKCSPQRNVCVGVCGHVCVGEVPLH